MKQIHKIPKEYKPWIDRTVYHGIIENHAKRYNKENTNSDQEGVKIRVPISFPSIFLCFFFMFYLSICFHSRSWKHDSVQCLHFLCRLLSTEVSTCFIRDDRHHIIIVYIQMIYGCYNLTKLVDLILRKRSDLNIKIIITQEDWYGSISLPYSSVYFSVAEYLLI